MSRGKSLKEFGSEAVAQAFPEIEKHKIKSQSSGPLPPKQVRWVSMTLVAPGPSVEPDIPPMQTPQTSHTETEAESVPYPDTGSIQGDESSLSHCIAI